MEGASINVPALETLELIGAGVDSFSLSTGGVFVCKLTGASINVVALETLELVGAGADSPSGSTTTFELEEETAVGAFKLSSSTVTVELEEDIPIETPGATGASRLGEGASVNVAGATGVPGGDADEVATPLRTGGASGERTPLKPAVKREGLREASELIEGVFVKVEVVNDELDPIEEDSFGIAGSAGASELTEGATVAVTGAMSIEGSAAEVLDSLGTSELVEGVPVDIAAPIETSELVVGGTAEGEESMSEEGALGLVRGTRGGASKLMDGAPSNGGVSTGLLETLSKPAVCSIGKVGPAGAQKRVSRSPETLSTAGSKPLLVSLGFKIVDSMGLVEGAPVVSAGTSIPLIGALLS